MAPTVIPTPSPTPTAEPWFPIYDPFIYGDNSNYDNENTCYDDVITADSVTRLYLAVRDAYRAKALAHTRVLALMGLDEGSSSLWLESLSRQRLNEAPIDVYFYSDRVNRHMLNDALVPQLMEFTQYTRPSRLVFGLGQIKREGFKTMLDWMVANANKGYFKNLKHFQVTDQQIAQCSDSGCGSTSEYVTALNTICNDKTNFPLLMTINLDNNKYEKYDAEYFASELAGACGAATGVTVSANTDQTKEVVYPDMCSAEYGQGYLYYDTTDETEIAQCRFNWNWEVKAYKSQYSNGPFPNDNSPMEC